MSDLVPRKDLTRQGVKGVGAVVGGAGLLILSSLGAVLGMIAGVALTVVGLSLTGSKSDRTAGIVATVAGVATVVSALHHIWPLFPNLSWLMWIPGIGLIAVGAYSLVRFIVNLKKRM